MKAFINEDFLLSSETAKILYHDYAEKMPVADYHCHINPQDIADDVRFTSITDMWLAHDHYKWRAMRCAGFSEDKIVEGVEKDPFGVFEAFAETLPMLIGNQLYHWTYLELKRYFGIEKQLTKETAREIYDEINGILANENITAREMIRRSNVTVVCTTDDPIDSLVYHKAIAEDETFDCKVFPSYRPDTAMAVDKPDFGAYIAKLADASGVAIDNFASLMEALYNRADFFDANGCKSADHGIYHMVYSEATDAELDAIFAEAVSGTIVDECKADKFKTAVLVALSKKYHELNWVMQIHFGVLRNNSQKNFERLGPDAGFDTINDKSGATKLSKLLNKMEQNETLPKMIFYSLNENDNMFISSLAGAFCSGGECKSKIQLGSAWWFNDHKKGMIKQLEDLANSGTLANFVGMLTDSRSFLSYTRHEYFRRILCNLIGEWAENGEVYPDMERLGKIVSDISYNNTMDFLRLR